jgi:hypothetical protein
MALNQECIEIALKRCAIPAIGFVIERDAFDASGAGAIQSSGARNIGDDENDFVGVLFSVE